MVWAFWVALLNDYTCVLLVRAAAKGTPDPATPSPRGSSANLAGEEERAGGGGGGGSSSVASAASDFEELAFAAGGPVVKLVAQLALCVLLLGSMCSNLAVIAEASSRVLSSLLPTSAVSHPLRHTGGVSGPQPLGGDGDATSTVGGAAVMLLVMALIITPLCATRNMTALHHVAGGGALLLAGLLLAVVSSSMSHTAAGWAVAMSPSSRVPGASASQAFVVLSFAFFVQPMLLPLLRELSESSLEQRQAQALGDLACSSGRGHADDASAFPAVTAADRVRAAEVLELATHVTMALALVVYALLGVCGVVAFGGATSEDILLNFTGPAGIVLDASMVLYLAVCFAPTCHALRRVIYGLWDGPAASCLAAAASALRLDSESSRSRSATRVDWTVHFRRVAVLNVASAGVALFVPRSETLFAITGAVGVSVVCYLFPLVLHMRLVRYRGVTAGEVAEEDASLAGTPPALPSATASLFRGDARGTAFALRWLDAWALPVLAVGVCTWLSVSGLQNTLHAR